MFNHFEKICRIIYRERKDSQRVMIKNHPDDEILADFADQRLTESDKDQIIKHLLVCDRCAEYLSTQLKISTHKSIEVPSALLDKIKQLLNQSITDSLFEIFIKLKDKALEIIQTTGGVLVGQELVPAPVLRSRKIDEFKEEISILKDFSRVRVLAKIQNKGIKSFNLTVNIQENKEQQIRPYLRATLMKDEVELESYLVDPAGNCVFENILPGNYLVRVSCLEQTEAVINLKVKV